jgi:hypothetical protein
MSNSVANSRQKFSARLKEKFRRLRKILVADFLYHGDFSRPTVVFCGGNLVRVGNNDDLINKQELRIVVKSPGLGV